ncbi:MAG: OsmC family protein [Ferruginibacter sp.]
MPDIHNYEVNLEWSEDRKGILTSPVLTHEIEVATPPEFPKGMAGIWSPEHLFVAAVNSCLMTSFLAIAENSKFEFIRFKCNAVGVVAMSEGKFQVTEITLKPLLTIAVSMHAEKAIRILEMSEKACFLANSVKTIIHLIPEIIVEVS